MAPSSYELEPAIVTSKHCNLTTYSSCSIEAQSTNRNPWHHGALASHLSGIISMMYVCRPPNSPQHLVLSQIMSPQWFFREIQRQISCKKPPHAFTYGTLDSRDHFILSKSNGHILRCLVCSFLTCFTFFPEGPSKQIINGEIFLSNKLTTVLFNWRQNVARWIFWLPCHLHR